MGLVAERLRVETPSLSHHVANPAELAHRIAVLAAVELGDALMRAAQRMLIHSLAVLPSHGLDPGQDVHALRMLRGSMTLEVEGLGSASTRNVEQSFAWTPPGRLASRSTAAG